MISIFFKSIKDNKFRQISELRAGSWINVENATEEDLAKIAEMTGLESTDLQDSLDHYEVPRIERQKEGILIYLRTPSERARQLHTEIITVVVTPKFFITISPNENAIVKRVLSSKLKITTTQPAKLLIHILLQTVQEYTMQIKNVRNKVLHRKNQMRKISTSDFLLFTEIEEILNQYLAALVPMNNVIEAIRSKKYISLFEEDQELLMDLLIGIKQSEDLCNVNLKSITSVRDSFQLIFTNNLNRTIKLLTSLTIILTIPTIIASLFGMNVTLPLSANPFAFMIIIATILLFSSTVLLIFYYKEWL